MSENWRHWSGPVTLSGYDTDSRLQGREDRGIPSVQVYNMLCPWAKGLTLSSGWYKGSVYRG